MALQTDCGFRSLRIKGGLLLSTHQLGVAGRWPHDCVAIGACHALRLVRASRPMGLCSPLMALQAGLVLFRDRRRRMLAEAQDRCGIDWILHMLTPRAVAVLTGPTFEVVAWAAEKQLAHRGLSEFVELVWVTSLTLFVTDVRGNGLLLRPEFSHRYQIKDTEDPGDAPYHSPPVHPVHLGSSLNPIPLCRRFSSQFLS